jgi:negative regulator of flagellin synthesis FlgM
MKIGQIDTKAVGTPATAERKTTQGAAKSGQGAEPSAKVELSNAATLMGADGTRAVEGDFDAQKVERIAQAIRDGKFTVNHEAIADKLIANAAELLGRAKQ